MAKQTVVTFDEALELTKGTKRHLLLGNGFSMAWKANVFAYGALFDQADFSKLTDACKTVFSALKTTNFEWVMKVLRDAAKVIQVYLKDGTGLAKKLISDADALREVLAQAIAQSHPDSPSDVTDQEYKACRRFLRHFEDYYTLNYDLLLYWTLMHGELTPDIKIPHDDGFRMPEDGPEDYVTWEVENTNKQNVHYLHGGLHIFDAGTEIQKYTWINTQVRLIDQIRAALKVNKFPLFVSEGSSDEKREKILHSGFLHRSYRSFINISGTLFIYGVSMAENDEHILKLIEHGKVQKIAVGLYRDPKTGYSEGIIKRAKVIAERRTAYSSKHPMDIIFFDAGSAKVWGH